MALVKKISSLRPPMATPKSGSHQTRDKLLAATLDLLLTHLPQNITAQMVLEKSGISRGSLYHHFEDISALLEVALVQSFAKTVDKSLIKFENIIKKAKNREEMLLELTKVTDATQQKSLRAIRFQRARLIVFSEDNPRLAKALAVEQQRLTDTIADLIGMAQERGWMFTGVDARSAAVLIQAYTLGMIVDDIVQEQMTQENWSALIHRLIQQVF